MAMRSVTLEVPANHSLLRKTGGADVWLEPLIGDIEKKELESHSCLTLMNDIVHSTLKANLIGTELMGRMSTLEKKDRESAKAISEARRIANETQLEAANWKEQFENAQGTIEELQENKELLECSFSKQLSKPSEEIRELKALVEKKEEYAGELVQSLTQAQADLRIYSDEICALKSSHASLEASLDSHLAEYQILKNDLAMWERGYGLLEENFNIEVSWAFLKSRRDALMEATQENFDLQSELAKVLDTIEKSQQPVDTPSPALGTPGAEKLLNEEVATTSMEAEAPVTLASLGDFNIPGPIEIAPISAPSEVVTVPVTAPENEIATSDVPTPSVTS
ncbi:COP1-interactive protein 1-like [Nicotiana sylvestris]|uniref:COP1-interactive protein 1-like n=1 Tax=Nicotiana sylvestris TaxID=4096 RepID=UPI00388C3A1F